MNKASQEKKKKKSEKIPNWGVIEVQRFTARDNTKTSQHGCVRWALREHLTPPCCDFACGGLEDHHKIILAFT